MGSTSCKIVRWCSGYGLYVPYSNVSTYMDAYMVSFTQSLQWLGGVAASLSTVFTVKLPYRSIRAVNLVGSSIVSLSCSFYATSIKLIITSPVPFADVSCTVFAHSRHLSQSVTWWHPVVSTVLPPIVSEYYSGYTVGSFPLQKSISQPSVGRYAW